MAIVPSDLATGWSTMFESLFVDEYNTTVAVERAQLNPLIMEIPLDDNQGNQITLDWLGAAPQMRQWVDEKQAQGLAKNEWNVKPLRYEASIGVDIDAMRDARFNVYVPRMREMAQNAGRLRFNLISALIKGGAAAKCYDGSNFFDTTHVEDGSGVQSNKIATTGTSQAQVTADFYTAKAALMGFVDGKGAPLQPSGFRPLVWIPNNPVLEQAFRNLQGATIISQTTNVLANSFDLVIDPTLTAASVTWYMFRTDGVMRPFIVCNREEANYRDNFASLEGDVFQKRRGMASVEARMGATYGLWQRGVQMT